MRIGGWIAVLLLLPLLLFVSFLWMCLALGAAHAWVFQGTFSDGWSMAWDRWYITIGWSLLFLGGTSATASRS